MVRFNGLTGAHAIYKSTLQQLIHSFIQCESHPNFLQAAGLKLFLSVLKRWNFSSRVTSTLKFKLSHIRNDCLASTGFDCVCVICGFPHKGKLTWTRLTRPQWDQLNNAFNYCHRNYCSAQLLTLIVSYLSSARTTHPQRPAVIFVSGDYLLFATVSLWNISSLPASYAEFEKSTFVSNLLRKCIFYKDSLCVFRWKFGRFQRKLVHVLFRR